MRTLYLIQITHVDSFY